MASDVSHPDNNLPLRWKGRLSEQPPIERASKPRKAKSIAEENTSPARVVMEPTEPKTDKGLPAFKIKQEIDPQPTASNTHATSDVTGVRPGAFIALVGIAIALVAAGFALLG